MGEELNEAKKISAEDHQHLMEENERLHKEIQAAAIAMGELEDPIEERVIAQQESDNLDFLALLDGAVPMDEKPAVRSTLHHANLAGIIQRLRDNAGKAKATLIENEKLKNQLEETLRIVEENARQG